MEDFVSGARGVGSVLRTVEEAAHVLRLSPSYMNKLRITGEGPTFCKIGRRVLYRHDDLEQWVHARRFTSTSDAEAA